MNYKRLITFGCSYTFGHGLSDCISRNNKAGENPSKFAWPNILAKKFNLPLENLSFPGSSNKMIWKTIVETKINSTDIVLINWTSPERWTIFKENDTVFIGATKKGKHTLNYYKNYYDDIDANLDFNLRINHANLFCNTNKIKNFHLICEPTQLKRLDFNKTPLLQSNIRFFDKTYPKALDGEHPGEDAHKAFAECVFKELITVDKNLNTLYNKKE
jgi:hypothetical protein